MPEILVKNHSDEPARHSPPHLYPKNLRELGRGGKLKCKTEEPGLAACMCELGTGSGNRGWQGLESTQATQKIGTFNG